MARSRPIGPASHDCESVSQNHIRAPVFHGRSDLMSWAPVVQSLLEWLWRILGVVTHVRVRSHRAAFAEPPQLAGMECFFITVTNLSLTREVEVTHAWFELPTGQVAATTDARPLPVRLKPEQVWSTWVPVREFPSPPPENTEGLSRVRLSDGRVAKGERDASIPHSGFVAGGKGRGPKIDG